MIIIGPPRHPHLRSTLLVCAPAVIPAHQVHQVVSCGMNFHCSCWWGSWFCGFHCSSLHYFLHPLHRFWPCVAFSVRPQLQHDSCFPPQIESLGQIYKCKCPSFPTQYTRIETILPLQKASFTTTLFPPPPPSPSLLQFVPRLESKLYIKLVCNCMILYNKYIRIIRRVGIGGGGACVKICFNCILSLNYL